MKILTCDIETNGLLNEATVVHCISTHDYETGEVVSFGPNQIEEGLKFLNTADKLVFHNGCGYDFRILLKLHNWSPKGSMLICDTFILSCLLFPEGQHSIAYWAKRLNLKQQKVEHEDWSVFSDDMLKRCEADVEIGSKVYRYLTECMDNAGGDFYEAEALEQEIAFIHSQQVIDGVRIDIPKAIKLYQKLKEELKSLETQVLNDVIPTVKIVGVSMKKQEDAREEGTKGQAAKTKSGNYTAVNKAYFNTEQLKELESLREDSSYDFSERLKASQAYHKLVKSTLAQGPFTKIEIDRINLNSPVQVTKLLLSLGWKPTEWNSKKLPDGSWVKTGPKLTEDSYKSLPAGLGQLIAKYNIVKHRKSILLTERKKDGKMTGILALASERESGRKDKRISADGFTCGTNTGRYRHFGIVNIPRPSTPYGEELRELFTVEYGSFLIGVDLSGIEAVVLAHYCLKYKGGQALADEILKGDFHQANADMWKVDRNTAKSILYALMYGAGAKKLESIADNGINGTKLKVLFYMKYPAIKLLIDDLESAYAANGTYIRTLDGRRVYIRSKHKLLNTLIQSAAAIIFKRWMIEVDRAMPACAKQIIAMHDELQVEYAGPMPDARHFGETMCDLATRVGKDLKINVPVTAEYKLGKNWKDCH